MRKKRNQRAKASHFLRVTSALNNVLKKSFFWALLYGFLSITAVFITAIIYFYTIIPKFEQLLDGREQGSVTFLDKNGEKFAWRGIQFDNSLRSELASRSLVNAIIAVEDRRFFKHFGISIRGILGAIRINLREGRGPFQGHGGSTITQQVAKLLCMMQRNKIEAECRRHSIARKILELPFSIALELKFSKAEILSLYMNRVYLGANAVGFEAAAQRYFDKPATDVNLAESAMLAGLLTAPTRYAPHRHLGLAKKRASIVLDLMADQGFISLEQADATKKKPANLTSNAMGTLGAHFADWVMFNAPRHLTRNTTEDILIKTTFDPFVQNVVETTVKTIFSKSVSKSSKAEVAVVVMKPNGEVLAMLGSRKTNRLQGTFNRAFQALRQPGSAFKPFVYATALNQNYSPDNVFSDSSEPPEDMRRYKYWPKNYNGIYLGAIDLTTALSESVNTVPVNLAAKLGINNVIKLATDLGVKSILTPNLSLALGSSEVSLLDLTSAYAGFLNLGYSVFPRGWTDLTLKNSGKPLITVTAHEGDRVMNEYATKALINMLREAVNRGTGRRAKIDDWEIAGKTGTSQNSRDAWFVGFTSRYVAGVWIGYDDNSALKGVTGGTLPAQIWATIMKEIHHVDPIPLPKISEDKYAKFFSNNGTSFQPFTGNPKQTNSFLNRLLNFFQEKNE